jgi:long-chain acyl-CoA synthetase
LLYFEIWNVMNVIELIQKNYQTIPDKVALTFRFQDEWVAVTWRSFWKEICRTANGLLSVGVKKGELVAIFSKNSKDWIVLDIATQAIGAITVPIYATNSLQQVEYIINEGAIKYILAGDELQYDVINTISGTHPNLFVLHSYKNDKAKDNSRYFPEWNNDFSSDFQYKACPAEDVATVIYTSGTTGIPKGVMLTHGNFSSVVDAHKSYFSFDNLHNDISISFLPLSHIFERAWTLFVLSQGGEVAVLDNPRTILEALKEVKPTMMCAVPRFYEKVYQTLVNKIEEAGSIQQKIFRMALNVGKLYAGKKQFNKKISLLLKLRYKFFHALIFKKIKNEFGGRLRFLPVGGAMLKKEISEFMAWVGVPIIVGYGLTETSATVTAYPTTHFQHGSVGKALPGIEIKIGDNDEILVKYTGVMKGYYKNSEETHQMFTADGFLKTGDCGRIDEEGNLYITDRIKDLMKTSNGKYITPQLIESSLQTYSGISQVMIIGEQRPYVTALIVPDFEALANEDPDFINYRNLLPEQKRSLLNSSFIREKFEKIIADEQAGHAPYERIKKFYLLVEELTVEKGEITPTLKIKRPVVLQKYSEAIASMYS